MKVAEKEEARQLRKDGKSVRKIAKILNISKGTVSIWVRDIELTDSQMFELNKRPGNPNIGKYKRDKYISKRKEYQRNGIERAKKGSPNYQSLCMLYWAEGKKSKNSLTFVNSDINMIKYYIRLVEEEFALDRNIDMKYSIHCYTSGSLTFEDILSYWKKELNLSCDHFNKSFVDILPKSSGGKKIGKLPYGTFTVMIHRTDIVQTIFGSIQSYAGFVNDNWLG